MGLLRQIINFILSLFTGKAAKNTGAKTAPATGGKKTTPVTPQPTPPPAPAPMPRPQPQPIPPPSPGGQLTVTEKQEGSTRVVTVTDGVERGIFREFIDPAAGWKGLYDGGQTDLLAFQQNQPGLAGQLNLTDEVFNVLRAISDNEGKFEAVNAYDGAFLSFGIFQWTLGTGTRAGELPALLLRLKDAFPDAFDTYFGQHGLGAVQTTPEGGFLLLNGTEVKSREQKDQFRAPEWVYRFWRAGKDPKVQAVQVKHAIGRLESFYFNWKVHNRRINEVITSQYGVALILDNHVNLPAHFLGALTSAMTATGLTDPSNWDTGEEKRLLAEYVKQRTRPQPYKGKNYGPMHNAAGRADTIGDYRAKTPPLSEARLSFQYNPNAQRSIDDNFVAPPEGYNPDDYPGPDEWMETWEGETE